jgi:hypothetical protein
MAAFVMNQSVPSSANSRVQKVQDRAHFQFLIPGEPVATGRPLEIAYLI